MVLTRFTWMFLLASFQYSYAQVPVNPNATQKTKDVLKYIYGAKKDGFITGQHNGSDVWSSGKDASIWDSRRVSEKLGVWPGLWGSDFGFTDADWTITQLQIARQRMVNRAIEMFKKGALVTITYHMVSPKYEENGSPSTHGWPKVKEELTEAEYKDVVTPGTKLYKNYIRNLDRIIPFFRQMEEANVPVVWRPFHEMNGIFWWGKGDGSKKHFVTLWKMTYNYLVKTHKINNLIWFWNPNHWTSAGYEDPSKSKFPGLDYVDMLGVDDYYWNTEGFLSEGDYNTLVSLAQGKPLAIGEGFNPDRLIPDPDWIKNNRPEYRWFMIWNQYWIHNRLDKDEHPDLWDNIKDVYNHPRAINMGDIDLLNDDNDYDPSCAKLTGEVIGTDGAWNDGSGTKDKVFDGSLSTIFDGPTADGVWAGLDLGSSKEICKIGCAPREGLGGRMVGGKFQASNSADFLSEVVDLYVITSAPESDERTYYNVSNTNSFRYVRYLSPDGGYGNVSEVEFYGSNDHQVSINNSTASGRKLAAEQQTQELELARLQPNPASQSVMVSLVGLTTGEAEVLMYNEAGTLVGTRQVHVGSPSESLKINVSGWNSGTYTITLRQGVTTISNKLVVLAD